MKTKGLLIGLILILGLLTACSGTKAPTGPVSFSNDVQPILQSRCANCHGNGRLQGGFSVLSYDSVMKGGRHGAAIVAGDSASSLLYQLVESGRMPQRGARLNSVQLQIIKNWIDEGANNN